MKDKYILQKGFILKSLAEKLIIIEVIMSVEIFFK